ncbi:MAG: hypothetical protein PHS02_02820 [Candidatus ainarchaeum sp.]|nr:hypothetical protein [Candidatus ainarchaeum sp.]
MHARSSVFLFINMLSESFSEKVLINKRNPACSVVHMKKYLVCALLALALLSGCITNPPASSPNNTIHYVPSDNVSPEPEANLSILMNLTENETTSIVYIKTLNRNGEWLFPLQNYSGEFAKAGLYSSVFIKLNSSQLKTLGNDESLWVTPYTSDGKGILFNAIFSKELSSCNLSAVRLLGKYYTLDYLKTSPNFNNDDKWKIATVSENGCIKRILIVQSGYFYNISENESIQLFTNDGSLSAQFKNLGSTPELIISGLKPAPPAPPEANATTQEFDILLKSDWGWSKQYHGTETMNSSGFYIEFDSPLPMIISQTISTVHNGSGAHLTIVNGIVEVNPWPDNNLTELLTELSLRGPDEIEPFIIFPSSIEGKEGEYNQARYIPIPGSETENYTITCLDHPDSDTSKICLGKEISRYTLHHWKSISQNDITLNGKKYRLDDFISLDLGPSSYRWLENSSIWSENCGTESSSVYYNTGAVLERLYGNVSGSVNTSNVALLCKGGRYPISNTETIFVTNFYSDSNDLSYVGNYVEFTYLVSDLEFENGKDGVVLGWVMINDTPALKSVFIPSTHPYYAQLLN